MLVVAVAVLVGLASISVLAVLVLRLWRGVKTLGADVATAGERIAAATAELDATAPRRVERPATPARPLRGF